MPEPIGGYPPSVDPVNQITQAANRASLDWTFILLWTLASGLGHSLGVFLGILAAVLLTGGIGSFSGRPATLMDSGSWVFYLVLSLAMAANGLGSGSAQWLLLRQRISAAGRWVGATMLGYASFVVFFLLDKGMVIFNLAAPPARVDVALIGFGFGVLVGLAQWLVLRHHVVGAGWWVLFNGLGCAGLLLTIDVFDLSWLTFIASLLVYGTVTGTGLLWLLRRSFSEA